MKKIIVMILVLAFVVLGTEKIRPADFKSTLSDKYGLPLDDGSYKVTFSIYSSYKGGELLNKEIKTVKCEDGICLTNLETLQDLAKKGHSIVWISIKTDNIPETTFRIKKYLDKVN